MSCLDYNTPIIPKWNVDNNGNKISVQILNEQAIVCDNKILLSQIPDEFYRVTISGLNEIDINEEITLSTQYKVNYSLGLIYFHPDQEAVNVTITEYYGRGWIYISSGRIYTELSGCGDVKETLQDIISVNKLYWQVPVLNFADIATTYPNPNEGWTVQTTSDNKVYRYYESTMSWIHIMTLSTSVASGINILDIGGYYTSTDVEGALQELGSSVGSIDSINTRIDGVDTRIDGVDTRIDGVDTTISNQDSRLTVVEDNLNNQETPLTVSLTQSSPVASIPEVTNGQGAEVVINGSFVTNHQPQPSVTTVTVDDSGSSIGFTNSGTMVINGGYTTNEPMHSIVTGERYLAVAKLKSTSVGKLGSSLYFRGADGTVANTAESIYEIVTGLYHARVIVPNSTQNANFKITESSGTGGSGLLDLEYVMLVNLTKQGDAETDIHKLVEKYPFVTGTQPLRNPVVKCVGENLCDGIWEEGQLVSSTGAYNNTTGVMRTSNFIDAKPSTNYRFLNENTTSLQLFMWDKDYNYLGFLGSTSVHTTVANTKYIKLVCTTTFNPNSKINYVEGTTIPTTYKPYKESISALDTWLGDDDVLTIGYDGEVEVEKEWESISLRDFYALAQAGIANSFIRFTNTLRVQLRTNSNLTGGVVDDGVISKFRNVPYSLDYTSDYLHQYMFYWGSTTKVNDFLIFIPLTEIDTYSGTDQEKFEAWLVDNDDYIYYKLATPQTETLSAEKGISTHSGEACTFSIESGIVVREKVVPKLYTDNLTWFLNGYNEASLGSTNAFNYKTNSSRVKVYEEIAGIETDITSRLTIITNDVANYYGGLRINSNAKSDFDPNKYNYYVDYEILHSEYNNQQVNATINYKQNTNDAINTIGQTVDRVSELTAQNTKVLAELTEPEEVFYPTLLNGWVNFNANYNSPQYWKDSNGYVHLIGNIKSGVIGIGQTAIELPIGYRPLKTTIFANASNNLFGETTVTSDGKVQTAVGSNTWFDFGHVTFKAGR